MSYSFFDLLELVGSLGMFLYGMKIMSEALQKVAGAKMRNILSAMTSNRFLGILTGFLVTSVVQSSSATTVMVVSFVNAGLINLSESIGVIMGANIGTTVTGWIISILGFKVKISVYAIPLIGIGLPFAFSKLSKRRSFGEILIGFALLFLGLEFLKDSVPDINSNPEILSFLRHYTDLGFGSTLIFLMIGTLLTIVIQSSSATMALTFVMCNNGWISFDLAAAMVLGENIGTTITANLAATVGNISAKRAAIVHLMFNSFGVIWMLIVFTPFISLIDNIITNHNGISPNEDAAMIPIALSLFHTVFNIANTLIFVWFVPQLKNVAVKLVKQKSTEEEEFRLKYITTGLLSTSELSLLQARKELQVFAKHTSKMFGFVEKLLLEKSDKKFTKLFAKVEKYENTCDDVEVEIANYLNEIAQGKLSDIGRKRLRAMLKLVSDLESIGDCNYNIARTINRMHETRIELNDVIVRKLDLMFSFIQESLAIMRDNLDMEEKLITLERAKTVESEINNYRNQLKSEHLDNLKNGFYNYETGIVFNDIFCECEKLADYVINVSEALYEVR
ncbi:MAG: Na/Pi cotransporter family protein [Marinilabiliaceae bacterium]|nr:Na/Pi cotransporter family protein [Marinilabiliaceae bacterium]